MVPHGGSNKVLLEHAGPYSCWTLLSVFDMKKTGPVFIRSQAVYTLHMYRQPV